MVAAWYFCDRLLHSHSPRAPISPSGEVAERETPFAVRDEAHGSHGPVGFFVCGPRENLVLLPAQHVVADVAWLDVVRDALRQQFPQVRANLVVVRDLERRGQQQLDLAGRDQPAPRVKPRLRPLIQVGIIPQPWRGRIDGEGFSWHAMHAGWKYHHSTAPAAIWRSVAASTADTSAAAPHATATSAASAMIQPPRRRCIGASSSSGSVCS